MRFPGRRLAIGIHRAGDVGVHILGQYAAEMADLHRAQLAANEVMAEQGYGQVRALDEFYVRMPTPGEVRRLELGPGTPVVYHIVTGVTDDDMPVRVVLNVLPGDRHVIVYERAKPHATDPDDPEG